MKKLSTWYFSIALMLTAASQIASASAIKEQDIRRYLDLSGVDLVLQSIPAQIQAMSQQMQLTEKDPTKVQNTMDILISSWDEKKIEESIANDVKNSFSVNEMKALLIWLEKDSTRKVKAAEERSSAPNFNQEFMQYMAKIQSTPPTKERVKTIRNFIESTDMVDHMLDMVIGITTGMTKTLQTANGKTLTDEELTAQMTQMEGMLKPQLEQQMIYVSYFIYEELSDAEINTYSDFYKTTLGKKEMDVMSKSIGNSLGMWAEESGKNIEAVYSKN
jgi:hypothetical protein